MATEALNAAYIAINFIAEGAQYSSTNLLRTNDFYKSAQNKKS